MKCKMAKARDTMRALVRAGHAPQEVVHRVASGFRLGEDEEADLLAEFETPGKGRSDG